MRASRFTLDRLHRVIVDQQDRASDGRVVIVSTLPELIAKIARALNVSLEQAERLVRATLHPDATLAGPGQPRRIRHADRGGKFDDPLLHGDRARGPCLGRTSFLDPPVAPKHAAHRSDSDLGDRRRVRARGLEPNGRADRAV